MSEGQLHLFMDIPFGIGIDECRQLVGEKYGFVLEEQPSYDREDQQHYRLIQPGTVDLFGLQVTVAFSFADNQLIHVYTSHTIGMASADIDALFSDSLNYYFSLLDIVDMSLGAPDDGKIDVLDPNLERKYYDYPIREGIRDKDLIRRTLIDLRASARYVIIAEVYGNVLVHLGHAHHGMGSTNPRWEALVGLFFSDNSHTLREALGGTEPFLGRDGSYPGLHEE